MEFSDEYSVDGGDLCRVQQHLFGSRNEHRSIAAAVPQKSVSAVVRDDPANKIDAPKARFVVYYPGWGSLRI